MNLITVERAIRDGISVFQIENCAKWHREQAEREDANGVPAGRRRHNDIAMRLDAVAKELAA